MADFLKEALQLEEQVVAWRRHIHQNAEIGCELPKTATYVESVLDSLEIQHRRFFGCGVAAWIGEGERSVMLRAVMDALPGNETSGLPYACSTGAVHACGHDIHTSMLLGAAKLLQAHRNELHGRVVLMFQPGEECLSGALGMVQDGLLDCFRPQLALAMHVNVADVPRGQVWIKQGVFNAASDIFEVMVTGRRGHGAHPQNAVNPIYAALHLIAAFTEISRYEVAPMQPNILTVCAIEAGDVGNVIPDRCVFRGSLRTLDEGSRNRVLERLRETTDLIARAQRCTSEFTVLGGTPCAENRPDVSAWVRESLVALLGKERIRTPVMTSMGSEDFSQISSRIPACYMSIGIPRAANCTVPLHNTSIVFEEENFYLGSAVFAHLAESYVNGTYLPEGWH